MTNFRFIPLLIALALPGCADPQTSTSRVQPVYDKHTGQLTELTYDENANGRIDTWVHLDGTRILRAEADHDEDGRIDRWEHYRAEGSHGTISRIEMSTHRDGRINRIELFVNGALDQVHEDTDRDGRIDKWETYRDSALAAVAYDIQRRGTPDRRLVYRPDGSLDRLEADADGDGTFVPVTPLATN
jgi:hypothetical protein